MKTNYFKFYWKGEKKQGGFLAERKAVNGSTIKRYTTIGGCWRDSTAENWHKGITYTVPCQAKVCVDWKGRPPFIV